MGGGGGGGGGRRNQAGSNLRKPRWDLSKLEPFKKEFYVPHPAVAERPYYQVEEWRKAKEITLKGKNIPEPVMSFEEAGSVPVLKLFVLVKTTALAGFRTTS